MTISPLSAVLRSSTITKSPSRICSSIIESPRTLQDVGVALAHEIVGHGDRLGRRDGLDRRAGGDEPEQRQFQGAAAAARRHQLDRAAAVPRPTDEPLLLEIRQVLVHRRERRQPEPAANLLEARRVAVLLDELPEVVENLALPLGEWKSHGTALLQAAPGGAAPSLSAKERRKSTGVLRSPRPMSPSFRRAV